MIRSTPSFPPYSYQLSIIEYRHARTDALGLWNSYAAEMNAREVAAPICSIGRNKLAIPLRMLRPRLPVPLQSALGLGNLVQEVAPFFDNGVVLVFHTALRMWSMKA